VRGLPGILIRMGAGEAAADRTVEADQFDDELKTVWWR
jgi:hypothetical protein